MNNHIKWKLMLMNLTVHSFEAGPRRVLFFDPLSGETHNGCPVVH